MPSPAAADAFSPSPAQHRLLLFMHENPSFKTVIELSAAAGVGRSTYYRWCQDPDFRLWFADAVRECGAREPRKCPGARPAALAPNFFEYAARASVCSRRAPSAVRPANPLGFKPPES
ncbi:MAG TPA: hypothetical protein VN515_08855 [Terriglobales bacterium]|nr:hypothetical protein [Terriglobales bacterium]